jgi:predicted GTPase
MATESRPHGEADEKENGDDVKVNIAVVGKAGSGKSSFVNTILGYSTKLF